MGGFIFWLAQPTLPQLTIAIYFLNVCFIALLFLSFYYNAILSLLIGWMTAAIASSLPQNRKIKCYKRFPQFSCKTCVIVVHCYCIYCCCYHHHHHDHTVQQHLLKVLLMLLLLWLFIVFICCLRQKNNNNKKYKKMNTCVRLLDLCFICIWNKNYICLHLNYSPIPIHLPSHACM